MTFKKKIITLSSAAVLSLSVTLSAVAVSIPFKDLSDVPAKDKIISLQERGIVAGTSEGIFSPNSRVTTVQALHMLVKTLDLNLNLVRFAKEPKATDYFTKADNDAWYANALITASVNGVEVDKDIEMNRFWTKEQFTNTLVTAMERHYKLPLPKIMPPEIKDAGQMSEQYGGAIQRALIYGVAELDEEGNFYPKDEITRAEAAELLYNAVELIKAHSAAAAD